MVGKYQKNLIESKKPGSSPVLDALFDDFILRLCTLFTLGMALLPPEGIPGFTFCASYLVTQAPCPGCGITRSGSNLLRGQLRRSFQFHPLGPPTCSLIFLLGILGLMPKKIRSGFQDWLKPYGRWLNILGILGLTLFAMVGLGRWILVMNSCLSFPATWP